MASEFTPHEIAWTDELSSRFWDYFSSSPAHEGSYFSKQQGDAVIRFARYHGAGFTGPTLDFGCGPGFLLESLVARGTACEGADFSPRSVEAARQRLSGNPLFRGATLLRAIPSCLKDGAFDTVFLLETIEHLLPEELGATLDEISRIMRTGGTVVATTPNDETLDTSKVICPDCGCIFHRWQHVSSWTAGRLTALMERAGFVTVCCKALILRSSSFWQALREIVARLRRERMPNLVYVGRKRESR